MPNRIPTPGIKAPAVRKSPNATPSPKRSYTPISTKGMTPQDKAYANMLNKVKGDITKVKGYDNGKRTE